MGVDVEFKARPLGSLTDNEVAELRDRFIKVMPVEFHDNGVRFPDLRWDEYDPVPTIEVASLTRYYGVGYERGPWPDIRAMGDWLAVALGERAELRYGGDADDEWESLTPWADARRENDAHWEQVGNKPYRAFFRNW